MTPPLCIIVPVHNGRESLTQCLQALRRTMTEADELIVIDDASVDGSAEIAGELATQLLVNDRRLGAGLSRNRGVAAARHEVVVFVDADVVVASDALDRLRAHFAVPDAPAALVGCYDVPPTTEPTLSRYRNTLHHATHQTVRGEASHFWTGLSGLRRSAFEAVGGFDDRPSIEDVIFGYRLRKSGETIAVDPELRGRHLKRWTLRSMVTTDAFVRAKPWTEELLTRRSLPSDFHLRPSARTAMGATCLGWLSLPAALWDVRALWVSAAALLVALVASAPILRVMFRRFGIGFGLATVPLHLLHLSSAAFGAACGLCGYLTTRLSPRAERSRVEPRRTTQDESHRTQAGRDRGATSVIDCGGPR